MLNLIKGKNLWATFLAVFIGIYLLFSMISISLSQIFISLSLVCWLVLLIREKQKFAFPSFFWPILAYVALSLVSSFLSVNPKLSLKDDRELLLFLLIPIVYAGFQKEKILMKANLALLVSGYLSCLYSIFYFIFKASPGERIKGFMGHYMTQAGLLLLFSCMALSMLIFYRKKIRYLWGLGLILSLFAIILTLTRNVWIGLIIASLLTLLLYKPVSAIIVPIVIGLFYLASPQPIKERALSIFSLKRGTNKGRIALMQVGIKVIRDFPLFGTGPDTVEIVIQNPKYGLSDEAKKAVHFHNNIIQTGAERGIPALLTWLAFMAWAFISLLKLLKNKDPSLRALTVAALAALAGLFTAGLFEYNFADSEITCLFLYMITIPFTLARIQQKTLVRG